MIRRILVAAALAACSITNTLAIERATFILIDGERKSGTVFSTPARENLVDNYLNLRTDDGPDMTFPVERVAVIDFAGDQPRQAEFDALPDDGMHLIVLRNGYAQPGRLVNLVGGETVRWKNADGQEQKYAIRDVKRIYLQADRARSVYNNDRNDGLGGTGRVAPPVATSGAIEPGTIRVDGRRTWTDTGMDVRRGDMLSFRASGQIQWAPERDSVSGPNGNHAAIRPDYPLPSAPVGMLIGRIGNGPAFSIGNQTQPLPMAATGRLWVGVNDNNFTDNSGYYTVHVTR